MNFLWLFSRLTLVLSGFASFVGLLQAVAIFFLINEAQVRIPRGTGGIPLLMLSHPRFFVLLGLLLYLTGFVASIALIRGKRWGQLAWAFLLAVGIAWSLAWVASEVFFPYPPPERVSAHVTHLWVGFISVLGTICAFALIYLLKKLLSTETTRHLTNR